MPWNMYLEPVESKIEPHSYFKNNAEFANILICSLKKIRTYLRT